MTVQIRDIQHDDEVAWHTLWQQYLAFYEHELPAEQTHRAWNVLISGHGPYFGKVAEREGTVVGFAHFSFTVSTWEEFPDLYLEDLFVSPDRRGTGIGRALIEALTDVARTHQARRVHWITKSDNRAARSLYDTLATRSDFVIYERLIVPERALTQVT